MYALVKPYNCIIWLNVVISFLSQVAVHLSKLFDNMSDLDFSNSEELDNPKGAVGMYSKEREYVPFLAQCRCEGPVRLCGKTKVMFVSFFLLTLLMVDCLRTRWKCGSLIWRSR